MADDDDDKILEGDCNKEGQASGEDDIINMEYLTDSSYRGSIIHGRYVWRVQGGKFFLQKFSTGWRALESSYSQLGPNI